MSIRLCVEHVDSGRVQDHSLRAVSRTVRGGCNGPKGYGTDSPMPITFVKRGRHVQMRHIPHFTLRRLEVFTVAAECGGFRAAADRLGMTQPSVSAHIEALEREVRGALFERRRGRSGCLTELGRTFLDHARKLLAEADSMAADVAKTRVRREQRIVFACQRSLTDVMSPLLAEFASQHREIELVTRVGRQEEVIELLRSAAADIGLCLSNDEIPGLRSVVIGEQQLVVVAAPNHPLARGRRIAPSELNRHDFVGAPENSLLGQQITRLLSGVGAGSIPVVSRATEFEVLRALVLREVGLYCCLHCHVAGDIAAGRLVALSLNSPPLTLCMRQAFPERRQSTGAVSAFAAFQRQRLSPATRFPEAPRWL
jgi:DNA-binding transcriptional LysR family regulator